MSKQREPGRAKEDKNLSAESGGRRYTHPYIQKSRSHWGWDCGYDSAWEAEPEASERLAGKDKSPRRT